MSKKIVTNLRIDEQDWLEVKAIAAEQGMSINEYLNFLIKDVSLRSSLGIPKKSKKTKKKEEIWDRWEALSKMPSEPMDLSEDDKIIYET